MQGPEAGQGWQPRGHGVQHTDTGTGPPNTRSPPGEGAPEAQLIHHCDGDATSNPRRTWRVGKVGSPTLQLSCPQAHTWLPSIREQAAGRPFPVTSTCFCGDTTPPGGA